MQKTNRPEFLISALLASLLIGFATSAAKLIEQSKVVKPVALDR